MPKRKITMIEYDVHIPYEDKGKTLHLGGKVRVWADRAQIVRGNDALDSELNLVKLEKVSLLFAEAAGLVQQFPKETEAL